MSEDRGTGQPNEPGAGREEVFSTNGGVVATAYGLSDIGCQRQINQDTLGNRLSQFAVKAPTMGLLYAVADGMGGHARGEVASARAIQELFARYYAVDPALEPRQALAQVMVETNSAVHQAGRDLGSGTMGTTLTTVLLRNNILYVGNIGDSRTYLVRGDKIKQLSQDHSLIGEQVRSGVLTEAQARTSSIRNVITRAVGYRDSVEPDIFAFTVNAGDILVLCSDGLHGLVENEEIAQNFSTKSLKTAVDDLINLARERGGHDNITALAIRIDQIGEVVLSEDDERTTDVAIIVPDDQTTRPMPSISPQHTDEIVADPPPAPPALSMPAPPAAPASAVPPPAPIAAPRAGPPPPPLATPPPVDPKAVTQVLQRVPPAPMTGPPLAPAPAIPLPQPARRSRIPVWFFVLLPLLLIGIVVAGVVAVRAMSAPGPVSTPTGRAIGVTPTAASVVATATAVSTPAPPTATPAAQATIAPVGGLPPAPTTTRTNTGPVAPLPTVGSQVPGSPAATVPAVPGTGLSVTIEGTIAFEKGILAPSNFATNWEVAFYDAAEFRDKKQAATVQQRAPIKDAGDGTFAFTTEMTLSLNTTKPFAVQVRQIDGKQVATSSTTEFTIPSPPRFALPLKITGFLEPQAPAPSPGGGERVRNAASEQLPEAVLGALPPRWSALMQRFVALR